MLLREQAQRLFELALAEFSSDWHTASSCIELSLHEPDHWVSGLGTFGFVVRNRRTGSAKILGWRTGELRNATYHRGISYRVLEAYADRMVDPIRRYLEEVGIASPAITRAVVPSWSGSLTRRG